jgi:hypothetical protein
MNPVNPMNPETPTNPVNPVNEPTTYRICWAYGGEWPGYPTHDAAVAAVFHECPDAEIGHDGDLTECPHDPGARTLCWAGEDAAAGDDGARAIATIRHGIQEE